MPPSNDYFEGSAVFELAMSDACEEKDKRGRDLSGGDEIVCVIVRERRRDCLCDSEGADAKLCALSNESIR
jgi:hypothetical protein